jgi:hypothetical protein
MRRPEVAEEMEVIFLLVLKIEVFWVLCCATG